MSGSGETQDNAIKYPELVFGLIGAVGTDSEKILDALDNALKQVRYTLLILICFQDECNYPRPCGDAAHASNIPC
jgi:hypothetical protein